MVVSCVTFWHEKRWIIKQNPGLGEKTEFSSYVIQHASGLSHLLTKGQADILKISYSSA